MNLNKSYMEIYHCCNTNFWQKDLYYESKRTLTNIFVSNFGVVMLDDFFINPLLLKVLVRHFEADIFDL